MNIYRNKTSGEIATETWLAATGINTSNPAVLEVLGWLPISYEYPVYDKLYESMAADGEPVLNLDGKGYTQKFRVSPLDDDALQASLDTLATAKADEARKRADEAVAPYMAEFSDVEKQTWAKQQAEVAAWIADNSAATPTLDGLANARGISRGLMLQKAIAKVTAFEPLSVAIVGRQQAYEDEIKSIVADNAKSLKDRILALQAMTFDYALAEAGEAAPNTGADA